MIPRFFVTKLLRIVNKRNIFYCPVKSYHVYLEKQTVKIETLHDNCQTLKKNHTDIVQMK